MTSLSVFLRISNTILLHNCCMQSLSSSSSSSSSSFCPKAGPSLQAEKPRLQFCRRHIFHRKLRNRGCSFTRDLIAAVASRSFPHPTLSIASEQTLKDLKEPRDTNEEVRKVDLANWALRASSKFTTGVIISVPSGFLTRSEIRKSQSPFAPYTVKY